MLALRALVKHYPLGDGEPVRALDGVCLQVGEGELVAVHGPSGSGKSTLLLLVASLLAPDSGSVRFGEREITTLSDEQAARYRLRELGFIAQQAELLPGARVVEQAALKLWLSDPRGAERRVLPLLERLGLGGRLRQRCAQLSLGERQRLTIALALSTQPRLVLADEPTGSLDSARSREVLGLLSEVCRERGTAMLLVTHDPQALAYADRTLELRDGRLAPSTALGGAAAPGDPRVSADRAAAA